MKDKSTRKDIYHSVVPTKVHEAHGMIRKFLYETPEELQDNLFWWGTFAQTKSLQPREYLEDEAG